MIDDVGYLEIFHKTLLDILETRRPDLIVFVSGADIYEGDRLGKLSISKKLSGAEIRHFFSMHPVSEQVSLP